MLEILRNLYLGLLVLLVFYALVSYRQVKKAGGQLLALALFLTIITEACGMSARVLIHNGQAVTWVFNVYTLCIVPVYLFILRESLPVRQQKLAQGTALFFVGLGLANFFLLQGIQQFNTYTIMLGAAVLIFFSLLYFKSRFDNLQEDLLRSWRFWVASGLLMYFTGTLLYFGLMNYLHQQGDHWLFSVYMILQVMNILLYLLIGVALLCLKPRQTLSPS